MPPQKEKNLHQKLNKADNADALKTTVFASSINAPQGLPPIPQNGNLATMKGPAYSLEEEDKEKNTNKKGKESSTAGDDDAQDGTGSDDGNVKGKDVKKKEDNNTVKNAESKTKDKEAKKKAPEKELEKKKKGEDNKQKEGSKEAAKRSRKTRKRGRKKQKADKNMVGAKMNAVQSAVKGTQDGPSTNNNPPAAQLQTPTSQGIKKPGKSKRGKQIKNVVVGRENLKHFNQSDIAKKTSSGNAVIGTDKPLNSKQKKASKPLPQAAIQAQKAATIAANSAFHSSTMSKIDAGIGQYKAEAARKKQELNISSVLALQEIESQKGLAEIGINNEFQKSVSALENHYSGLKASANAKLNEYNAFVENAFTQGTGQIEQKLQEALAKSDQMGQDTITKANTSIDNHINRVRTAAQTQGASAKKQGYDRYDVIMAEKLPETSGWDDFVDGSDYEKNKREARAKAVRTLGKETEKKFLETAEQTAAELLKSKSGIATEITENVGKLKETLGDQKEKAVEGQTTLKEQALEKGKSKIDAYLNSLDSQQQTDIQSLTSMKDAKLQQLNSTASSLKNNVTTQTTNLQQSIQSQTSTTLGQLQQAKSSINDICVKSLEVSTSTYVNIVSGQANQFEGIKGGAMQALSQVSAQINGVKDAGKNAGNSLNQFLQASIQEISNIASTAKSTSNATHQSTMSSMDTEKSTTKTNFDNAVKTYSQQNTQMITSVEQSFTKAAGDIDTNIKENSDKVIQGFDQEMAAFPKTMSEHEKKAEKSVKPRWKKLLSVVIDIVFAVALAVIVAVIVASGLGIVGMLIAGAIAGAVLAVGKQMINNAIDGEPIMKDTLKAAALGAVEGVFGVLTAGVGGQIMGKIGGKLTSMGANSIVSAGTKIGQKAVTKVVTEVVANVGEAVTKQIIENLFDDKKKWYDGLLKTVATGTIDSLVGLGSKKVAGGITSKTNLGKQVGETTRNKVMREGIELTSDFVGNSISSGVGNVANNWDDIMDGDEGLFDTFKDGAVNDWDSNLVKSSTRNAKDAATNRVNDRIASHRMAKDNIETTDPGEGYKFSMDKGELGIRRTHDFDSEGNKLEDKKFSDHLKSSDDQGGTQTPQQGQAEDPAKKTPQQDQTEDPTKRKPTQQEDQTPKKPADSEEDVKKTTPESEPEVKPKNDEEQTGSTSSDKTKQNSSLDDDGYRKSKSAQEAKDRGLPPAGELYRYNTSKNGELYIQRIRKVVDGEEIPVKKIENGEVVTKDTGKDEGGDRFMEDSSKKEESAEETGPWKSGWDEEKILELPKDSRPHPSEYLEQSYIDDHISKFNEEGGAFIVVKSWIEGGRFEEFPIRKYAMLKSDMERALAKYKETGDVKDIEDALGYESGDLEGLEDELFVFYPDNSKFNFDMPDGNEIGANDLWEPGGKTSGGYREAVLIDNTDPTSAIRHEKSIDSLKSQFEWEKL